MDKTIHFKVDDLTVKNWWENKPFRNNHRLVTSIPDEADRTAETDQAETDQTSHRWFTKPSLAITDLLHFGHHLGPRSHGVTRHVR